MGFGAPKEGALPTIKALMQDAHGPQELEVIIFDNRGIGKSSSPEDPKTYTTSNMAEDVRVLLDHLGWHSAHIVGYSMGGMIATKFAAHHSDRVQSLTLLSVSGGGPEVVPWRHLGRLMALLASRTPQNRCKQAIRFHFSKHTRKLKLPDGRQVGEVLLEEFVANDALKRQPRHGQQGQLNAVWTHRVTAEDVQNIHMGGFPVRYLHGRHDVFALPRHAVRLARRMNAPLCLVDAGHAVLRESVQEICGEVLANIKAVSLDAVLGPSSIMQVEAAAAATAKRHPSSGHKQGAWWEVDEVVTKGVPEVLQQRVFTVAYKSLVLGL